MPATPCNDSHTLPALGGNRALVERARALAARGKPGVLCVVAQTQGSTYRKPGALVLLDADGVRAGALSGGCLEAELEERARTVFASGRAIAARFDTSGDEDRVFGSGTGCGGSTHVLLLPLPPAASPLRDALIDANERSLGLRLVLARAPATLGAGEARVGTTRDSERICRFDRNGVTSASASPIEAPVTLSIKPPARLLLLGAGPETRSLLCLTRLLGWQVELVEHRERWSRFAEHCGIDRVHRDGPAMLPRLLEHAHYDAALVMNHSLDLDARCLTLLAGTGIGYIGLLGPPERRDNLLREIGETNAALLRTRLHAPVGLPLGGEGAEAIALAIVAQLQLDFSRHAQA